MVHHKSFTISKNSQLCFILSSDYKLCLTLSFVTFYLIIWPHASIDAEARGYPPFSNSKNSQLIS